LGDLWLAFFATTINYVDRQVQILPRTSHSLGWNELQRNIVAAFNAAYALGLLAAGRFMDPLVRASYPLALSIWSLAAKGRVSQFGTGIWHRASGPGNR
jgi:ACS family hexuronate transporter-like MFS transporter